MHEAGSEVGRAGVRAEKTALRARLLEARARRSADDRAAAGRLIRDHVLSLPEAQMAGTVAAYFSVGAEPDTRGLIYALWKRGTYVILPLLRPDGDLDWASYEGPDSLTPGPRGLLEPAEPPRGPDAVARAGLVLVPALAVDRKGNRLGRGGGSFDRALARVGPRVPVIALLHEGELLERVPVEPHDRPIGRAALPSRGIVSLQIALLRSAIISTRIVRVLASRDASTRLCAGPGRRPGLRRLSVEGESVPTYQYACTECGESTEMVQKFSDDPLTVCPVCGGRLRKVFSPVGIVFKGSGFYRTDSRSGNGAVTGAKEKTSEPNGSGSGSNGSGPDSKGEKAGASSSSSSGSSSSGSSSSGSSSSSSSSSGSSSSGSSGEKVA